MEPLKEIYYLERKSGKKKKENVYHERALHFLYGGNKLGKCLNFLLSTVPLFSSFVGWVQRLPSSRKKILPFIQNYGLDATEFVKPVAAFASFDDFFTRTLKAERRPLAPEETKAIIPADGRFLFYPEIDRADGFVVKGKKFSLPTLLQNEKWVEHFHKGSMVLGRLCPSDYHRFHFPVECTAGLPHLVKGPLYSVNPLALQHNLAILAENKRMITELHSPLFGTVLYIEVGATCVGTIHQTFTPFRLYKKGEEKGYFSFGGSTVILLFEPHTIEFDRDLIEASLQHIEILCLMGESMGNKKNA